VFSEPQETSDGAIDQPSDVPWRDPQPVGERPLVARPHPMQLRDQRRPSARHAVQGHLLDMAGDHDAAHHAYQLATRLTTSIPERQLQ
jgi:hypothetical protein